MRIQQVVVQQHPKALPKCLVLESMGSGITFQHRCQYAVPLQYLRYATMLTSTGIALELGAALSTD